MTTNNEMMELRKMMQEMAVRINSLAGSSGVEDVGGVVNVETSARTGVGASDAGSSGVAVVAGSSSRGEELIRQYEVSRGGGCVVPHPSGAVSSSSRSTSSERSVEFVDAEIEAAVEDPSAAVAGVTFGYFNVEPEVREVVTSDGQGVDVTGATGGGLMKQYVNSVTARGARALLVKGGVLPSAKMSSAFAFDFALSLYASGSVPEFFRDGRRRLRSLAAVGDSAITLVVVARSEEIGADVASAQSVRNTSLSNAHMSQSMRSSALAQFVVTPAGGTLSSRIGADALEAVAGALFKHRGLDAVRRFIQWIRLV